MKMIHVSACNEPHMQGLRSSANEWSNKKKIPSIPITYNSQIIHSYNSHKWIPQQQLKENKKEEERI